MGNTLLILGNGFDLDLGFRTSYGPLWKVKNFKIFKRQHI